MRDPGILARGLCKQEEKQLQAVSLNTENALTIFQQQVMLKLGDPRAFPH